MSPLTPLPTDEATDTGRNRARRQMLSTIVYVPDMPPPVKARAPMVPAPTPKLPADLVARFEAWRQSLPLPLPSKLDAFVYLIERGLHAVGALPPAPPT